MEGMGMNEEEVAMETIVARLLPDDGDGGELVRMLRDIHVLLERNLLQSQRTEGKVDQVGIRLEEVHRRVGRIEEAALVIGAGKRNGDAAGEDYYEDDKIHIIKTEPGEVEAPLESSLTPSPCFLGAFDEIIFTQLTEDIANDFSPEVKIEDTEDINDEIEAESLSLGSEDPLQLDAADNVDCSDGQPDSGTAEEYNDNYQLVVPGTSQDCGKECYPKTSKITCEKSHSAKLQDFMRQRIDLMESANSTIVIKKRVPGRLPEKEDIQDNVACSNSDAEPPGKLKKGRPKSNYEQESSSEGSSSLVKGKKQLTKKKQGLLSLRTKTSEKRKVSKLGGHQGNTVMKIYSCKDCKKLFTCMASVTRHYQAIHMGIRPYPCGSCHRTFYRPTELRKHVLSHGMEEGKFSGKVCSEKFNEAENLPDHKHTNKQSQGKQEYRCKICSKAFNQRRSMQIHMGVHTRLKRRLHLVPPLDKKITVCTVCTVCDRKFSCQASRQLHYDAVHLGLRPHVCSICGKSFHYKSNLQVHLIRVHGETNPLPRKKRQSFK